MPESGSLRSAADVPSGVGKVYLVGAGPGDPGLLTLRGQECLALADVVLYDGLVDSSHLRHTRAACERTSRAVSPEGKRLDQQEINERLVRWGLAGKTVVRLKGGDPYLFGRGGEEAAALAAAGIPFEVVPGVTAAIAAAAYAGVSLTHRHWASSVAFITGHEDPEKMQSNLDYQALAAFSGTLVFYMGLHRVGTICEALVAAGKPGSTPAMVISRATTPRQRSVEGTLRDLAVKVQQASLHAPSLIVVGDCIQERDRLGWFEQRPLLGLRIGIPRPAGQAEAVAEQVRQLGGEAVVMPLLEIHPPHDWSAVDAALTRLTSFDWLVFTSVNGVEAFMGRLWDRGGDTRWLGGLQLAAIGPATAGALEQFHLRADVIPQEFRAEGLASALLPLVAGKKVLWAGADRGREVLTDSLATAGATLEKIVCYRSCDSTTLPSEAEALLQAGELHWIALSSPAMARRLAEILPCGPARRNPGGYAVGQY